MFIQTEADADPAVLKFLPGRTVMDAGTVSFPDRESSARSPLAARLFEIENVVAVTLGVDLVSVTKAGDTEWQVLKPAILSAIMEHFMSGAPAVTAASGADDSQIEEDFAPEDAELVAQIKDLLDSRVRPALAQNGGEAVFHGFSEGKVALEMSGAAFGLRSGIENMLRHYIAEVEQVIDHRDLIPKPGLETPTGLAVRDVLDQRINPSVAMHGGHIALVDVTDDTVYIRLEGGCQGCGMADVTLKQGVEGEIKRAAPDIVHVLDVTDHAGGTNPYYQPSK